ncbi:right-handed parallel beta-helix repeat-containing protein [Flavilitoribacter nigricans]|nr:right-handed parallel beta-helix repeat-containing protein [Flavilitoribacter nigricans]
MSSKLIAPFCLIAILLSVHLPATTYYLDYTNGSNANDGQSEANAWKDLFKIRDVGPMPGDVFLFKRGEVWPGLQMYVTASGTAGNPITYGAYGDLADDLPIITTVDALTDANTAGNWTESMTNIWTLSLPITPGRLYLDGTEYLRASTLADVGTSDSEGSFGHWFYDAAADLLYLYATENPAGLYSLFAGSKEFYSALVFDADYMIFENLDFRGGSGAALAVLGGANIEIRNCRLGNAGNTGVLLADATVSAMSQTSSNITVTDNVFDSDFTFFYGLGSERGCGDGLRLRKGANDCTVSNNTFINWAHNAIELLGDGATADGVNNNQFYDNHISAPDIPYAHPLGADGYSGKCQNNEFYRNYIEDCRTASQINGNNNWVHHNIIIGMRRSPSKAQATAHAFVLGIYGTGLVSENNRFDHNLIIDTDESAFLVRGYGYAGQVENNAIRNNILYETGLAPYGNAYPTGTGLVIYDTNLDGVGANTYQNNLFYSSILGPEAVYDQDNAMIYTSTEFNALNGTDGNTISANDTGDPLFTDFANGNFLPMDNSPAVNAGIDVGLLVDYALQDRFVGPAPDIGPLETDVTAPLPVEWGGFGLELVAETVELTWTTLLEVNADHFQVERSADGLHFTSIGRVMAVGNSSVPRDYQFTDNFPPVGLVYYRLRQVDVDGAFEYSSILSVDIAKEVELQLIRPYREQLQIVAPADWDWSGTTVRVFSMNGRKLLEAKGTDRISLRELPRAAYLVLLQSGGRSETFQFVK